MTPCEKLRAKPLTVFEGTAVLPLRRDPVTSRVSEAGRHKRNTSLPPWKRTLCEAKLDVARIHEGVNHWRRRHLRQKLFFIEDFETLLDHREDFKVSDLERIRDRDQETLAKAVLKGNELEVVGRPKKFDEISGIK